MKMETFKKYFRRYFATVGLLYTLYFVSQKLWGDPMPQNILLSGLVLTLVLTISDLVRSKINAKKNAPS